MSEKPKVDESGLESLLADALADFEEAKDEKGF
jgi:hypothetical protein